MSELPVRPVWSAAGDKRQPADLWTWPAVPQAPLR
jgi:hypothetical protein